MKINAKLPFHSLDPAEPIPATLLNKNYRARLNPLMEQQNKLRKITSSKNSHNYEFLRSTLCSNRSQGKAQTLDDMFYKGKRIARKMTCEAVIENEEAAEQPDVLPYYQSQNKTVASKPEIDHKWHAHSGGFKEEPRMKFRTYTQAGNLKPSTPTTAPFQTPKAHSPYTSPKNRQQISCFSLRLSATLKEATCLNDFQKLKYLGGGNFGQVFLVCHKKTNSIFALKQIRKELVIKNKLQDQLLMEIKMQLFLCHPNILKLYGFFHDANNVFLILEAMEEGTLYSHLKRKKKLKEREASKKIRDIVDGIQYLHEKNIAHRDIKPENILIENDVCKICDFGWAALCDDRRKTLCGTIDYVCPQLLEGKQYGIAIDLWCLGVLCFELTVGKAPFYHLSRKQTMKKIMRADSSDINIPSNIPNETRDFINRLLRKNPEERMKAEEALTHPLILKYKDDGLEDFRCSMKKKY